MALEVVIHVAGRLDLHPGHHLIHGNLVFDYERRFGESGRRRAGIGAGDHYECASQSQNGY